QGPGDARAAGRDGHRAGGRHAGTVRRALAGRACEMGQLREAVRDQDRTMKPEILPGLNTDFRAALARLRAAGRLRTLNREADPDLEIAAIMKRLDGAEALLFPKVKGHSLPVIGNLLASQANCESAFGVGYREIREFVARALGSPVSPQKVSGAPCQEHVFKDNFD